LFLKTFAVATQELLPCHACSFDVWCNSKHRYLSLPFGFIYFTGW
jgi:hypothetical protein